MLGLRAAVEGLSFYIASNSTLVRKFPMLELVNETIVEELKKQNKFLQTGLNKVSARLTFADTSQIDVNMFKYKAFRHGISLNYIPSLSEKCRSSMEGSFSLVDDHVNTELCQSKEQRPTTIQKLLLVETHLETKRLMEILENGKEEQKQDLNQDE